MSNKRCLDCGSLVLDDSTQCIFCDGICLIDIPTEDVKDPEFLSNEDMEFNYD